jgi:hypothetical protein
MKITLWAFISDEPLEASVNGDVLTLNGEAIDLSGIPEGYRLPTSAVNNELFLTMASQYVERINGELHFALRLPVKIDSPEEFRNPATPIVLDVLSGAVPFPDTTPIVIDQEFIEVMEVPEDGGSEQA